MKLGCLQLLLIFSVCACNIAPKTQPAKIATTVKSVQTDLNTPRVVKAPPCKAGNSLRDITGKYEEMDNEQTEELNEGCNISVNIKRNAKGFSYHLTTPDKNYRGKITMVKISDRKFGIVFEGMKYAEYKGEMSQKTDTDDAQKSESPVGIGGELERDTITIQNNGDAMNYYVKIGGCQVKYIRLVKIN